MAMEHHAVDADLPDRATRRLIIGLIVWVLLQVPRLIAIPLIDGVLDGTESDAWMFPAILDVVVAVAAPFVAFALWRVRGLGVWVLAVIFFAVSIIDHMDAVTAGLLAPAPQLFGGASGPPPALVPSIQALIDVVALAVLTRRNVMAHYLVAGPVWKCG